MAEEKSIKIKQEPLKVRDATKYVVSANVWYDPGEIKFTVDTEPIGNPDHFLIYESKINIRNRRVTQPIDIGHSREEASQKAYMHALNIAKDRINYIRDKFKGLEVSLVDETVRGVE
jgi:hypothetical protein